jgi:hypothetical protein
MAQASFSIDTCNADAVNQDPFLAARLECARACPARPEYMELCFTTPEGPWNWCFPEPLQPSARSGKRPAGPIALTVGPYSVLARPVLDDGLGPALDNSVALPMILAGADVVVARRLVTAGR